MDPLLYVAISPNGIEDVSTQASSPEHKAAALRLYKGLIEGLIQIDSDARNTPVWASKGKNGLWISTEG